MWYAAAGLAGLAALLVVPPLVSLNHYQKRITGLMSASLGRPVRLSEVSVRLLPRPAFVLSNVNVEEDPAYGVEPVLHANSVVAPIRLLALWRGKLELSRISVDEASVNLVRAPDGRWNLDSIFGRAAAQAGAGAAEAAKPHHLPYLRATNSRINIKSGAEKLPFSLVDTDLSLWQDRPGEWRLQLKGQPARTDLSLTQGDTGIVELDATVKNAAQVRLMPVRLDMQWREAQLGQLTQLVLGRDAGWRGDLRGELHMEGTAEAAQVKTRLRAAGVHREEFAPVSPMDFDANCGFVYHYSVHAVENLQCESPLGSGRVRITGEIPGQLPGAGASRMTVELDKIPVAAGLDALRTVRSGLGAGLEAAGTVSGKIAYVATVSGSSAEQKPAAAGRAAWANKLAGAEPSPLSGGLTVDGFQLSGGGLSQPLTAEKIVLEAAAGQTAALTGTVAFPAGGAAPLTVSLRVDAKGYQVALHGQASVARARELAHATGMKSAAALDALAGDPLGVDLTAAGPWMPAEKIDLSEAGGALAAEREKNHPDPGAVPMDDSLTGTVVLRNANWKADYLVNHVQIAQATLHMEDGGLRWEPVAFSYGPLKGTASLRLPAGCGDCAPRFAVQFGTLDAATLQAALLGAPTKGTLLSQMIDRLHPAEAAVWPRLAGTVKADALVLGPVTLRKATLDLTMNAAGAEITALEGELLGGRAYIAGTVKAGAKPEYELSGSLEKLSPAAVGQLIGERWSGGEVNAAGKLNVAGYTGDDLAGSATGALHLNWKRGSVSGAAGTVPPALARFERWTAEAEIGQGKLTLGQNEAVQGASKSAVQGSVTLSVPAKANFVTPKDSRAKR
jgi:hypothetical protein